ncbi:hypothetical protein [Ralstonia solanacearum]|uniref:hypothetical protein n=1 Tax=Ralstonia solanacearum TaxID=305 RepID=UPI001F155F05|nr:hypothetical protein [Ralstonia solanacearum]
MRGDGPGNLVAPGHRRAPTAVVLSGPQYHYALTEVAIGTGALPLGRVEWGLNSVLNEGATGIHIGVGNGLNGIHFDFISTEARLDGI